ncbi:MAG: LptA/OstA family protein [Anaeromyxobacteraceae bacterium]|nr:LptA/OstA family protein [Anaeromyxobacteraceae bacterium]
MIAPLLLAAGLALAAAPVAAPPQPAAAAPARPAAPARGNAPPGLRPDKPVRMDADEVRFSWKTRQVTVVGKPLVTLLHDDATLTCRRLTGENDPAGKLKVATCEGEVKLTRGERTVTCDRATYDRPAALVVCSGNPVLRDPGGTEARATTLTWDLGADEVRLEGDAQVTVPGGQLDLGAGQVAPPQPPPAGGGR